MLGLLNPVSDHTARGSKQREPRLSLKMIIILASVILMMMMIIIIIVVIFWQTLSVQL